MAGTPGRSGGRNKKVATGGSDGKPVSPRPLSESATTYFKWLLTRLGTGKKESAWCKIDGTLLATLAELLESQERVSTMLAQMPESLELHRLRNALAGQVQRMSAVIGLSPIDRARLPAELPVDGKEDPFAAIMRRMSAGN
jgi:hypothetical protein